MSEAYQYAVLRVVPRIERGERLNAGVVVYSRRHGFLAARTQLDRERLAALDPGADPDAIEAELARRVAVAAGDPAGGAVAAMPQSERFGWLTAASSTTVQPSPIHTGLCDDPQAMLDHLYARLVLPAAPGDQAAP
jgi:hypothetical protein